MAAALSYYILFAIVPLTMFIVSVLATVVGSDSVQQRITDAISETFELSAIDVTLELTYDGREAIAEEQGQEAVAAIEDELSRLNSDDAAQGERAEIAADLASDDSVTIAGFPVKPDDIDVHYENIVLETIFGRRKQQHTRDVRQLFRAGICRHGPVRRRAAIAELRLGYAQTAALCEGAALECGVPADAARPRDYRVDFAAVAVGHRIGVAARARSDGVRRPAGRAPVGSRGVFIPLAISFVTFLVLYRFGPKKHNRFRDVWPGALLAALGFEALKFGYAIYATNFATFDVVYGALGGVLLFMFFTYLCAYVFLMGAELAAEYPSVIRGVHDDEPVPPLETAKALRDRLPPTLRGLLGGKRDQP